MSGVSNHYDSMVAIKSVIDGLSLSGLTGGTVVQEVCRYQDGQTTLPFISISPYGPEGVSPATDTRDDVEYGILVAIVAKPDVTALETRLGWRQALRRRFYNQSLEALGNTSVPLNTTFNIRPGNAVEPKAFLDRSAFISGFVIKVECREPRS